MREIKLYPHNQKTFENVCYMIECGEKRIGIVQPTGTGKSYLIVRILQYMDTDSVVLLSPSNHINQQIIGIDNESFLGKTFLTYSKLSVMADSEVKTLEPKMIILDEFHRCGAEIWGKSVQNLLKTYPDAIVIGTSATPIRYLDGVKDMGEELFGNNLAVNMTLADAIVEGLLPTPKYITALYDFTETVETTRRMINISKNTEDEKKELFKRIEMAKNHLEQSNGVPVILKKYFNLEHPKTIVFCKNKEHLTEMMPNVLEWFRIAYKDYLIKSYVVLSDLGTTANMNVLKAFEDDSEGIQILFAINILNEGIHIDSVKNLIFLRKSSSPIIIRQQTGRALNAGMDAVPVIFDLVNNIKSMESKWLSDEIKESVVSFDSDGEKNIPEFDIYDELIEIEKVFSEIESLLTFSWDKYYELLLSFKSTFGHINITRRYVDPETNLALGQWLTSQRINYKSGTLLKERSDKLIEAGVDLERDYFNDHWNDMYEDLVEFYNVHGHLIIPISPKYKTLNSWCGAQRSDFRNKRLSQERETKLKSIHFEFNYTDLKLNHLMNLYLEAHSKGIVIDSNTKHYKGKNLYHWVLRTRKLYESNELSSSIIDKLNAIDFQWSSPYISEDERWELLMDWLKYNSIDKLTIYVNHKGYNLGYWYHGLKTSARNNELSDELLSKLNEIGFRYDKYTDVMWEKGSDLYRRYVNGEMLDDADITYAKNWEMRQRKNWKENKLTQDRIDFLKSLGFVFDIEKGKTWDESYEILKDYYTEFGSCDISNSVASYHDYNLYEWIIRQRKLFNKNKLSSEQIDKLNEINFIWDKKAFDWMKAYNILNEYYLIHGHSNPLRGHIHQEFNIGDWVRAQRDRLKTNRISTKEKELLDNLNFRWQ